jgi:hypothetical protein
MIAALPLVVTLFAGLQWNYLPGLLLIGLPSGVTVESVCIEEQFVTEFCVTPDNSVVVAVPLDEPPTAVRATVRDHDGAVRTLSAYPLPSYSG